MSKNKLFLICVIVWVLVTLLRVAFHQPWYAESHAYMLAQNYSILDLIAEMRVEGHLLIWYLLIMPFAKLKLWYPYPMLIINWIFAFVALLLMWKKAPFHPVTKAIITFSYPFLAELPVVARCYSIGVMLLVIITSLYHKSLKHPIWYSVLIFLCANTSVMALFGVTAFGIIFVCDLIKGALNNEVSKKDFRISFSILAIAGVVILWQLFSAMSYPVPNDGTFLAFFSDFLLGYSGTHSVLLKYLFTSVIAVTALFTAILFLIKDRRIFFIWLLPIMLMLWCFIFKHSGYSHHYIFFWIYTMLGYWLLYPKLQDNGKLRKAAEIILASFFIVMLFSKGITNASVYNSHTGIISDIIKHKTVAPARIVLVTRPLEAVAPYLEKENIEIYTYEKASPVQECEIMNVANDSTYFKISPDWLKKSLSDDRNNYVLIPDIVEGGGEPVPLKFATNRLAIYMLPVAYVKNGYILYKVLD